MKHRAPALLTAAAALVAGSGGVAAWRLETAEPALRVYLSHPEATSESTVGVTPGVAGVFHVATVFPREDLVIERVRPMHIDPGVTVRTSRVILVGPNGSYPGRVAVGGGILQGCEPWPPRGYGPTYPAEGAQVPARGYINVIVWATTGATTGTHGFTGVEITLKRPTGSRRVTLRQTGVRVQMRAVPPEVFTDDDQTGEWCLMHPDSTWSSPWPGITS